MMKSGMNKKDDTLIWQRNLQNLEKFKKKNGHCNVPEGYAPDPPLAVWVKNIRAHRKKVPQWVEKVLLKLKFDFEYKPSSWEVRYNQLRDFYQQHHHTHIPSKEAMYSSLYFWTNLLRKSKDKLTQTQRNSLDKLKFDWERSGSWDIRLKELAEFKKEHGHITVPRSMKVLNRWIQNLRKIEDRISKEKKKQLASLGFLWSADIEKANAQAWEKHYQELVAFQREHGHIIVPKSMGVLNRWIRTLRKSEKRISKEKKKRLALLGFLWSADIEKANAQAWEKHYQELVAFQRKHGHTRVPLSMKLYSWCRTLRVREKYISEERKKKLAKIGFAWTRDIANAHVKNWERHYSELAAFKKKHGHTIIPPSMEELYNWTYTLKRRKRYLSEERIARLNKIGFLWTGEFEITRWESRYQELVEFKKKYGHTVVPMSMKSLYLWCLTLRQKEEHVSREHKQRLNQIGFRWSKDISQKQEQQWLEKFNKLKTFFKIHGHFKVPEKETQLYNFLKYQRDTWMRGTIKPERKKMLRSIGFKIK